MSEIDDARRRAGTRGAPPAPGSVGIREAVAGVRALAVRLAADCEKDARALDLTEFTGLAVGEAMGEHLAMTHANAKLIEGLAVAIDLITCQVDALDAKINRMAQAVGG